MKRKINYYLLILPFLALFASCSRDVFDEYYARPDYLEDPIYQQLDARGNFKNFTALIEKAGYKDILSKAGYWTMFAPNDEAFTKYFQEKGISDVSKIDDATAAKIVKYALVYNAFREDQLSDYQSATGWVKDNAFRRRTAYYDGFLTKTINGQQKVVVGSNRNNRTGTNYYISGDNNNKYISYFTKEFFAAGNLTAFDFNFFYPSVNYTGFNVLDGNVKEANIIAENGIIHEVDKVELPLLNLDQYLEQDSDLGVNSKYSLFRSILENNLVDYVFNQDATNTYRNFTGKSDNAYVKVYDQGLSFSPNNENYLKQADNDGQSNAYTMIVPENAALQEFINKILTKHFTMSSLPKYVFQDFINAHMVQNAVWPSKAVASSNALGESLRFNFNSDIVDAKILSNGFFYGANKVQKSNLFYSVYTSAYLDPKYTFATRLFNDGSGLKQMISNINTRYTLFLPSDAVLLSLGFDYNISRQEWKYTSPVTGVADAANIARFRLLRVLYNGIVLTPHGELDNIATSSGIIRSGDLDLPGEYIKWSNNKVYAAGNEVVGGVGVNIIGQEDQQNGRTYYIDKVLEYTEEAPGLKIQRLAEATGSQFSFFYNYLKASKIFFAAGKIDGVVLGTSYTFVIPSNTAITQAVKDGVLPGIVATGVPNYSPTSESDREQVADFIRYHILSGKTASDDGLTMGQVETLRKNSFGDKTYVTVESTPGTLSFKDKNFRDAKYIKVLSNNLADRSLIHLVDNYLKFTE